ncbi:hypothetical protein HMPREF9336_02353 [Segniliparus rugosus ATCC BAA-974]|uniref:Uncharacterized protein n=1 Tax=Segniliparus rugosus (strain ATCC BAA-974 / DSM 45345 / CCUG 50838 / CIP 108380 / JCM 13579 / CDC 945) TaxID=679197 RepID=E5XS81_SEGRC|nr:hypothetical protein HMPREF9336_02353 [Segniliparus rugosus ATCC BAA-974]
MIGLALLVPRSAADADDQRPSGPTQRGTDSYGKPSPVNGWKNCAEAPAHGVAAIVRGGPGYNPALDPTNGGARRLGASRRRSLERHATPHLFDLDHIFR